MSPLAHMVRAGIQGYRYTLSGLIGRECRFLPTCSEYALEAVATHGAWHGSGLALRRIARCHPWGGSGYDPVPPPSRHCPSRHCPGRHCPGRH